MTTTRASSDALDQLHADVCLSVVEELERAMDRARQHPGDPAFAVSPQLIDKAMKFLAMNGVTAPASSPRVDRMVGVLANLDPDAEMAHGRH